MTRVKGADAEPDFISFKYHQFHCADTTGIKTPLGPEARLFGQARVGGKFLREIVFSDMFGAKEEFFFRQVFPMAPAVTEPAVEIIPPAFPFAQNRLIADEASAAGQGFPAPDEKFSLLFETQVMKGQAHPDNVGAPFAGDFFEKIPADEPLRTRQALHILLRQDQRDIGKVHAGITPDACAAQGLRHEFRVSAS